MKPSTNGYVHRADQCRWCRDHDVTQMELDRPIWPAVLMFVALTVIVFAGLASIVAGAARLVGR